MTTNLKSGVFSRQILLASGYLDLLAAQAVAAGLLASDMGERVVSNLTTKIYNYVTRPNPKDIQLSLTVIKQPFAALSSIAQNVGADTKLDANAIPDSIVLIRAREVPNFNGLYVAFIWLAPLFWLLTSITFVLYIYLGRQRYATYVYRSYFAILIVGVLCLMIAAYLPSSLGAMVPDNNVSEIANNLGTAFLTTLTSQAWLMLGVSTLAIIVFALRFHIYRLATSLFVRFTSPNRKAG